MSDTWGIPLMFERLSNTPARLQERSRRTADMRLVQATGGDAHSKGQRGLARLWLWHGALLAVLLCLWYQWRRYSLRSPDTPSRAILTHGLF